MIWALAADLVLVLHLAFIAFALLGALLALRWPWTAIVQIPAAGWAVATELFALGCPLTPLEQTLRRLAGERSYAGGFIEQYLAPLIYPAGLSPGFQVWLGVLVMVVNAAIYGWLLFQLAARRGR